MAKPLVIRILAAQPAVIVDNAAMALGTVIFVALNFFGQKIVVFRKTGKRKQGTKEQRN